MAGEAQNKATIAKLKAEYKGKVDILCGIEWDSLSEDKPENYDYLPVFLPYR